jgi:hypothetical protein
MRKLKLDEFGMKMDDGNCLECFGGGGKGGSPAPVVAKQVNPSPPVEETGLDMDEDGKKKKEQTGRASLKMPIVTGDSVGLSTPSSTGLKI